MIEYIDAKNGEKTMKINDYFLHSKYNPSYEARQFVQQFHKPGHIHIIFGYGAGHFVRAFQNTIKEKIIVIDPIQSEWHTDDSKTVKIDWENDERELKKILDKLIKITDFINVIVSPNYDKVVPEYYKKFLEVVNSKLHTDLVSENTLRFFKSQWQRNYILNLQHVIRDNSIDILHKKVGLPIIIASGGPSLTKQLSKLKEIREYIVLIASGSTINTLMFEGIEPDFTVSVDGGEGNYKHYKDLQFTSNRLIYSMYNHPGIRNSFLEGYYFVDKNQSSGLEHLAEFIDEVPVAINGGGSVANYALSIALFISNGPIALIGQDLAYTNNRTHASNNKNEKIVDDSFKKNRKLFKTKGYYGDSVLTDYVFLNMKESFESIIQNSDRKEDVFNCTEGGIFINGMVNIPFDEFCDKYLDCNSKEINLTLQKKDLELERNIKKTLLKINEEMETYRKLQRLFTESLALLKKNSSNKYFSNDILKKLDNNDKKISKLLSITALNISFKVINFEIIKYFKATKNETQEEQFKRVFKQSETLYKEMLLATDHAKQYLNELIIKLENGR